MGRRTNLLEVGLDELQLLRLLRESRPELGLDLLLPQDELDTTARVVGLGELLVDLGVELELESVLPELVFARKVELGGCKLDL